MAIIQQFVASVSWLHDIGGYPVPMDSTIVKAVVESAKCGNGRPVVHKTPVNKDMIIKLQDHMFPTGSTRLLSNLRDYAYLLLSLQGFLRCSQAVNICRAHITLHFDYIDLYIPISKTDPLAVGNHVFIARLSDKLCALTWITRYFVKQKSRILILVTYLGLCIILLALNLGVSEVQTNHLPTVH